MTSRGYFTAFYLSRGHGLSTEGAHEAAAHAVQEKAAFIMRADGSVDWDLALNRLADRRGETREEMDAKCNAFHHDLMGQLGQLPEKSAMFIAAKVAEFPPKDDEKDESPEHEKSESPDKESKEEKGESPAHEKSEAPEQEAGEDAPPGGDSQGQSVPAATMGSVAPTPQQPPMPPGGQMAPVDPNAMENEIMNVNHHAMDLAEDGNEQVQSATSDIQDSLMQQAQMLPEPYKSNITASIMRASEPEGEEGMPPEMGQPEMGQPEMGQPEMPMPTGPAMPDPAQQGHPLQGVMDYQLDDQEPKFAQVGAVVWDATKVAAGG